jgi:hypothetical protein
MFTIRQVSTAHRALQKKMNALFTPEQQDEAAYYGDLEAPPTSYEWRFDLNGFEYRLTYSFEAKKVSVLRKPASKQILKHFSFGG